MFFACVLVLMFAGSVLSFWQFRSVSSYVSRVTRAERRASELLRLNSRLLNFMSQLHRVAEEERADPFRTEAYRLLREFGSRSAKADALLVEIAGESDRHAMLVGGIRAMLDSLPSRVSSLVTLSDEGDWLALHARLLNQTDRTDDIVAALTEQVDEDLALARQGLNQDLEAAQRRATNTLIAVGVLGLAAAIALGTLITRSITHPLSKLAQGARALAAGDFKYRIPVIGSDELSDLAKVFNHSAASIAQLFEEVQRERATAQAAQAALQERAQELARANADLEQFAYSASHDLKEPLRIVALYSQMLQRKYAGQLDRDADDYMNYLYRAARQMEQLINDLLTYTKTAQAHSEPLEPTSAHKVLDRVLGTLEPEIRAQRCTVSSEQLPTVLAHEIHVQQLFQNLIGNAMKYRSEIDPEIEIRAEAKGPDWLFSIRDNGIGIEPQYTTQVFGIFKRLHGHKYPGTGIGLAICQRIVDGYGGTIWVESEPGQGSTFRFTLPAADGHGKVT
jgi:signal transduction histidine kinase